MSNILFIHGILGKPDYFRFLYPYIPDGYSYTDILLEGHGSDPSAFAHASMKRWRRQVADAVDTLRKDGSSLVIAAHSMGTLFAIDNAIKGNADALFLLNPPLSLRVTRRLLTTPLKILRGNINDEWTLAAKEAYSISDDRNILHYAGWIPRYIELFGEIRRTRAIINKLTTPTHVFLSAHDEMVSPGAAALFPCSSAIETSILPESGHYRYAPTYRAAVGRDFSEFLSRL